MLGELYYLQKIRAVPNLAAKNPYKWFLCLALQVGMPQKCGDISSCCSSVACQQVLENLSTGKMVVGRGSSVEGVWARGACPLGITSKG